MGLGAVIVEAGLLFCDEKEGVVWGVGDHSSVCSLCQPLLLFLARSDCRGRAALPAVVILGKVNRDKMVTSARHLRVTW